MKLYLEYTFDDISNTLSKSVSTVKTIYYNGMARKKIIKRIGGDFIT